MTADTTHKPESAPEGVLGWLSWSLLAVGILGVAAYGLTWKPTVSMGERPERQLPAFELDDQDGNKVSLDSLRGKVWVGTFMFTNCTNACPAMAAELLKIQKTIRNDSTLDGKLRLVSFSLDPATDTRQRLAEYSSRQGIDSSCWSFLRGERREIVLLCRDGFGLSAGGSAGAAGPVLHSDRFVLVDAEGKVRGNFRPSTVAGDLKKLFEAARALIQENGEGRG